MAPKFKEIGIGFLGEIPAEKVLHYVQVAERSGFGSCWIAEDYFYRSAFSTASACAMVTERIKLGIGVVNPYTRHPVMTAIEIATLDAFSKGRAVLGIGASNKHWIQEQMGIPFDRPLVAVKETVDIIRRVLSEERFSYQGQMFSTNKVKLDFPVVRRNVPIMVGVKGTKALELCGQIADGVHLSVLTSPGYLKYARAQLEKGARRAGRVLDDFRVMAYIPIAIDQDAKKARDAVRPIIAKYMGLFGPHPILTTVGLTEEDIGPFQEAFRQGRIATELVTEELVDTFTIAGTPEHCRKRLEEYLEAGLDVPIVLEIPKIDFQTLIDSIVEEIMPYFVEVSS